MLPVEYFHIMQFPIGPLGKERNYGSTMNSYETLLTEDNSVRVMQKTFLNSGVLFL